MSINQNFPEIRPSLNLNFARSKILDPRITFTRASTATYVGADGLIKTAVADEARFDHDPVTGESLGLLIEESRTNLLSNSLNVAFSNSADSNSWLVGISAPDGSNDARKCTTNNRAFRDYPAFGNANVLTTYSVYLRADSTLTRTLKAMRRSTGTFLASKSITITEQWQRFDVSFTSTTDGVRIEIIGGILGIEAWGCQLELGSFPTSYIPTSGSTVTRAADVASIEGNEFAKTNLLTYSERFDQSAWTKENVSLTPNASTAPDGTTTAEEVLATGNGRHRVSQQVSGSVGYVFSIFVKSNGTSHVSIKCSGGDLATEFDIVNGTIARSGPNGGLTDPFVTPLANEWYRIGGTVSTSNNWLIGTSDGTSSYNSTADINYTAQPGDAYYIWGAQLEEGDELTKYTPSVESFVSRASTGTYVGSDGLIKTSRVNLLKYSEEFNQSVWIKQNGPSLTPNTAVAPDGTQTADKIEFSSAAAQRLYQGGTITGTVTFSCYVRSVSGNVPTKISTYNPTDGIQQKNFTATPEWQRVELTVTLTYSSSTGFYPVTSLANGDEFYIWGAQLEEGTTATDYIPTGATISGAPRFDHDPVTLESLGLLIEESRTNELIFSSTLDGYGTSGIASKTQNAGIAPDGTNTAVLAETISNGNDSHLRELTSQVVNTTYTYSFFAKPGTVDYAVVYNIAKNGVGLTWFNVANGTIGTTASGVTPFIKPAGNGWYRVGVTLTTDSTITNNLVDIRWSLSDGVNNPTTGENVYVWGAQLEVGSFPTSYIPTSGSTVTRAADVSTSALGVDSWYNQSEGTVFAKLQHPDISGNKAYVSLSGSGTEKIAWLATVGSSQIRLDNPTIFSRVFSPQEQANTKTKVALSFKDSPLSSALDGSPQTGLTYSGSLPTIDRLELGGTLSGHGPFNSTISRLAYYQTRLSDDKLKSITSKPNPYPYMQSIVYNITNSGGTFILRSFGTVNYSVSWNNDESYEESTSNTLSNTYSAGNHVVRVYSDGVYRPYFNNVTADASQITSVVIGSGVDLGTNLDSAWYGASNMTSFVCPFNATTGVTDFSAAWLDCLSLPSFPLIDTSDGTIFYNTWRGCRFVDFPALDFSSATNFNRAWLGSRTENFPANLFDTTGTLISQAFTFAWINGALTAQSIENILVSLDTNGATGITLAINGGTNADASTWSVSAIVAYKRLINKGWTITQNGTVPAIITYGITSTGGVFNLRSTGTVNYEAVWGDGNTETSTINTLPHTYAAGNYSLAVNSNVAYRPYFNLVTADASQITSVVVGSGADLGTDLNSAWEGGSNLATFTCPFNVTSSVTSFEAAWARTALTIFPLIDTSSGTNFHAPWYNCANLVSFPLLNVSSGVNFDYAWTGCTSLTDFPANMFDTTGTLIAGAFNAAWAVCALTAQSIENILVSLDTNGATGITLTISGGTNASKTTWSAAAVTAYNNLIVKGWTISFNA